LPAEAVDLGGEREWAGSAHPGIVIVSLSAMCCAIIRLKP
jgi:hypothetical protein